jgi:hypothetical protein
MVLDEFDKHHSTEKLPFGISANLFRLFIVFHDLGKPYDRKKDQRTDEYNETLRIMKKMLQDIGCNEKNIELFSSLIKNNFLGKYLSFKEKEYGNFKIVGDMITKEANRLDISVKDFYDIIELYYKCDA